MNKMMKMAFALLFAVFAVSSASAIGSVYAYGDPSVRDDREAHLGAVYAPDYLKEHGKLDLGKWYTDWATCKRYAEENGIPVVFIWSNESCTHCWFSNLAFLEPSFTEWAATHDAGKVIYCFMSNREKDAKGAYLPDQEGSAAYNWMWKGGGATINTYPFTVLYWARDGKILANVRKSGDSLGGTGNLNKTSIPIRAANTIAKMESAFKDWHLADDKKNPFVLPVSRDGYGKSSLYLMSGSNWIKIETTESTKYAVRVLMVESHDLISGPFAATSDDVTISAIDEKFGAGFQFMANEKSEALICLTAQANVSIQLQYVAMDADVPVAFPCAAPIVTHSTESGDYGPERVTLSATAADAQIRYTLDGGTVSESSTLYEGPFVVEETTTVKAKAFRSGWAESEEVCAVIELKMHCEDGGPYAETVDGVEWMFIVQGGKAGIFNLGYGISSSQCVPMEEGLEYQGDITVPSVLGGCPVAAILSGVFYNCSELTSVVIPEDVIEIGASAFYGCSKLASVTIPSSVIRIGGSAFSGCSGLTEVHISDLAAWCRIAFGNGSANPLSYAHKLFINGAETTDIEIPDGVTSIPNYTFYNYHALTSATIPKGVTSIGQEAFSGCSGLTSVTIPSSVTSIGQAAFADCCGLADSDGFVIVGGVLCGYFGASPSVVVPCGVKRIGDGVFEGRSDLASVSIPEGVRSIGQRAFADCSGLTKVMIPSSVMHMGAEVFCGCSGLVDVVIPNGVMSIPDGAFMECSNLKSVTIPPGVKYVGESAFAGCCKLTSVVCSASIIKGGAFSGCENLSSVRMEGGVVSMHDWVFDGCDNLSSLTIPEGVVEIGELPLLSLIEFEGKPPLRWEESVQDLANVDIRYNVKYKDLWESEFERVGVAVAGGSRESYEPAVPSAPAQPTIVTAGSVVVSNVFVHYILNSVRPEFAVKPADDVDFKNIITEVKGGAVAVPESWAANYANFTEKFGDDFTKALMMSTGKIGTGGTPMLVWQDYVAGTDPTDEKDVFTASITIVDGKATISYSPELDDDRKAMRKYTIWGKASLMDANWTEVQEGHEAEYNFFKVSVEMR